ncbi:MAG: twin-arginine translocase TatA/TatE family subunit [Acidimicrobiales bacterium]
MEFLSPAKLLVIFVVALFVLGPEKLPKMARQAGGLWGDFRKFRDRLESDVRGSFPDLPSTDKIAQAVRSPLSFLETFVDPTTSENLPTSTAAVGSGAIDGSGEEVEPSAIANRPIGFVQATEEGPGVLFGGPGGVVHRVRTSGVLVPDDPGMN